MLLDRPVLSVDRERREIREVDQIRNPEEALDFSSFPYFKLRTVRRSNHVESRGQRYFELQNFSTFISAARFVSARIRCQTTRNVGYRAKEVAVHG